MIIGKKTIHFRLLLVQYTLILHRFLKKWLKNQHWSFSCCLLSLLPLNDLQGEIDGLVGTNVVNDQLQTGQMDAPTVIRAVKDSVATDATLDIGQRGKKKDDCQDGEYLRKRCDNKETQTEPFAPSYADGVAHELRTCAT